MTRVPTAYGSCGTFATGTTSTFDTLRGASSSVGVVSFGLLFLRGGEGNRRLEIGLAFIILLAVLLVLRGDDT